MEKIRKVFFDPLATSKDRIRALLKEAPVGSAHPFRPDGLLLVHSAPGIITEVDISMHKEEYFSNAISLAELGDGVLERMKLFPSQLQKFNDEYMIQQAPAATFKVPLVPHEITVFAVSKRAPTYYDLCIADSGQRTSCFNATSTFPGLVHSGDVNSGTILLQHIKILPEALKEVPYAVFVSGYSHTKLTSYKEENPVVLIANHSEKVLYVVPVPLDVASIGDAILCVPLVFKADLADNSLLCSILPTPTTDDNLMCSGASLPSDSFKKGIERADFTLGPVAAISDLAEDEVGGADHQMALEVNSGLNTTAQLQPHKKHVLLATRKVVLPDIWDSEATQVLRFGNGIDWIIDNQYSAIETASQSVLPCILGGILEGPLLLATGDAATNVPFDNGTELRRYYQAAESILVVLDEHMTDNSRNLATPWRINGLFIVQAATEAVSEDADVIPLLEGLNINAVTAIAGPQSLVLAKVGNRYYFYRGIASHKYRTTDWKFGQDLTDFMVNVDVGTLMDSRWPRIVNISQPNKVFLPESRKEVYPEELKNIFQEMSIADVRAAKDDILGAAPQLQALLNQKDLEELCSNLLALVQSKINSIVAPERKFYIDFVARDYKVGNPELQKKKNLLLASLRRATKEMESDTGWLTQCLGNLISSQNTSTRKHDLKRLMRKNAIRNNVEAVKTMTFEKVAALLEEYAEEMGVLLVNVDTIKYRELLANPLSTGAVVSQCCDLDSRILHLEGFDAGIILEQSQTQHSGPLVSQAGSSQPILALPYLSQENGTGSMLAWVCWDEFVTLEDPYSVRWVEKCNDAHIAAFRIIMRSTISNSVTSRDYNMTASSLETGQLMGTLLMVAMEKLAKMRTTTPIAVTHATDTSMKLMRGLFGHFLTLAGSGTNPLSKVFQLFSLYPQLDVPTTRITWNWYENMAKLFPFTGWPQTQLNQNLEKLLDKVIFRLITKNKISYAVGGGEYRLKQMQSYRRKRNVQLLHSRTIVMALIQIHKEKEGRAEMAKNLLRVLPEHVENETPSYTRLYIYVKRLAEGGEMRYSSVAANVFTKRSAAFKELKKILSEEIQDGSESKITEVCQKIKDKHIDICLQLGAKPEHVKLQGIASIQKLLDGAAGKLPRDKKLVIDIKGDAEIIRQPWQLGKGEYGTVDSLDLEWLNSVLKGTIEPDMLKKYTELSEVANAQAKEEVGWAKFEKLVQSTFLKKMEALSTCDEVCTMLEMPSSMMRTFIQVLAPDFPWERLPAAFQGVVASLLENPNQETAKPSRQLFGAMAIKASD